MPSMLDQSRDNIDKSNSQINDSDGGVSVETGVYEHYKGRRYRVYEVALHSETLEPMVVYRCMYGDQDLWVRPAAMFTELVEVNGEPRARFKLLSSDDLSP